MKYILISNCVQSKSNPSTATCQVAVDESQSYLQQLASALFTAKEHHPREQCVAAFSRSHWSTRRQIAISKAKVPSYVAEAKSV
jgi:hypothetical protein